MEEELELMEEELELMELELELMEEEEEVVAVRTMKRMNISRSEYCS
jgi:hypothetical protein